MHHPVVHFDIGCRDLNKTSSFYCELFGWNATEYGPLSKKLNTRCSEGIQGHITALGHEPHQYVMFYIESDNIKESLEQIIHLGGEVVIPETEIPGGGHFAWFKDPEGNQLGLYRK